MGLYVVIAVLSIRPTLRFLRWKRTVDQGGALPAEAEVRAVRRIIHIELAHPGRNFPSAPCAAARTKGLFRSKSFPRILLTRQNIRSRDLPASVLDTF